MLSILILVILFSLLVLEFLARKNIINQEISRKLLHIISVSVAGFSFFIIQKRENLVFIGVLAFLILFLLIKWDLIASIENRKRKSWGILFIAVTYIFLSLIWCSENCWVVFLSLLILALSDAFAGIIGSRYSKQFFNLTGDNKSLLGSSVFFISCFLILLLIPVMKDSNKIFEILPNVSIDLQYLNKILVISIILTLIEAISSKGSDNLFVPIFASFMIYFFLFKQSTELSLNFSIAILLATAISIASYKLKFLTLSGSVFTFLLATFIYGFGQWKWTLPILTFFVLSSLLSKIRKNRNQNVEEYFEKTGTRDHWQVMSNGGFAGILILLYQFNPNEIFYLMYLASIASVCADTWSTEIGTLRKHKTFNILNLREIEQGISGGVSLIGSLGGLIGSIVISLSGVFWLKENIAEILMLISFVGFIGSLFDSILGSILQVQYKCTVCNKITERKNHCNKKTEYSKGIKFFDNDLVNFSTSIFGALILLLFMMIY